MSGSETKILIGSPILQTPAILKEFLDSLKRLDKNNLHIEYMFVDNNTEEASTALLQDFQKEIPLVHLEKDDTKGNYRRSEDTHFWNRVLMDKVARFKNRIIDFAVEEDFDYLFFIDSDLVLHPNVLKHLISCDKDIISEIFWTQWKPKAMPQPNVWLYDNYDMAHQEITEILSPIETQIRRYKFLTGLRLPGIHKVGGLGACTLISREPLVRGVNFSRIPNIKYLKGEDRFFCVRAAVLGFELFVDTRYPAYHIYRDSELEGLDKYIAKCQEDEDKPL